MIYNKFKQTRENTEDICKLLKIEDFSVQPSEYASPPKWHLAHTTWFFEQFVLIPHKKQYKEYDADFAYLFNSYYNHLGDRVLRPNRGLMTRPLVDQVLEYRAYVTNAVLELLEQQPSEEVISVVTLGLNHEEQHQELLVYDIKTILGNQPTFPKYGDAFDLAEVKSSSDFVTLEEGMYTIGYQGEGFYFDAEKGAHKVFIEQTSFSNRLVTNQEYIEFIEAGGYQDFDLWHAEGWEFIQTNNIKAPMYWHKSNDKWHRYTLNGFGLINLKQPVMHISYYEAFAYAQWRGMRLPTEFEWEAASSLFEWGTLWEWTSSAFEPYPRFTKAEGAIGEYNGKFMVSQQVLRGASVATPKGHSRASYRNFFHPSMRWQFAGIRLVK